MPVDVNNGQGAGHGPGAWAAVLAERQQHIRDTAKCVGCGATKRFCDLLHETNTDTTAPEWFGCCAIGYPPMPCRHVEDKRMTGELLVEAASGMVRTVAEAYPPPVQGPARVSMAWQLEQDVWWYPHGRPAVRIASMDKPHRWNLARWLERRADQLQAADQWKMFTGFLSADMPDDVAGDILRESSMEWLQRQPLYLALVRGLPRPGTPKAERLAERAKHWNSCPMRKAVANPPQDRCVCVEVGGRTVAATNDPASMAAAGVTA